MRLSFTLCDFSSCLVYLCFFIAYLQSEKRKKHPGIRVLLLCDPDDSVIQDMFVVTGQREVHVIMATVPVPVGDLLSYGFQEGAGGTVFMDADHGFLCGRG